MRCFRLVLGRSHCEDVEDIVQNGYMGVLEIISHLQNLATVMAYQVISRLILQEPINPWSIAPLVVHPMLLALFAVCRRKPTIQVQQAENSARSNLVSQMQSATWPLKELYLKGRRMVRMGRRSI